MKHTSYRSRITVAGAALAIVLGAAACPSSVHQTYKGFESAVDKNATCADLVDMRNRFSDPDDVSRADAELARIGCVTRDSVRTDR